MSSFPVVGGIFDTILCWIKQIGTMVLNALIDLVNLLIVGMAALLDAALDAWPVDSPEMPTMPDGFRDALGWIAWSPIPIYGLFQFAALVVTVMTALWIAGPIFRWLKVLGD